MIRHGTLIQTAVTYKKIQISRKNSNKENLKLIKKICQIYQEILKASETNHTSWKGLQLMCTLLARIY